MTPLISVTLPTHNRPELLAEAVSSVIAQRFSDWELIIVDDGSKVTVDLGKFPQLSGRARLQRNPVPIGGAASKSVGAAMAATDLVTFLDDDDVYDERFLRETVRVMHRYPEIDVLFVDVAWFGREAEGFAAFHAASLELVLKYSEPERLDGDVVLFGKELFLQLLHRVPMAFQRVVVRRRCLEEIGYYPAGCPIWDCDWALRAALTHRCALLTLPLYRQRAEGQGYHSNPRTNLAQHYSAVDMVTRLSEQASHRIGTRERDAIRQAIARNEADLAYLLGQDGALLESWHAWWRSQRAAPSLHRWKMPLGALWRFAANLCRRGGEKAHHPGKVRNPSTPSEGEPMAEMKA